MNNSDKLQIELFNSIQLNTGKKRSIIIQELEELLNISTDSAYRRLRGETPLTLAELEKINKVYQNIISNIFKNSDDSVRFVYNGPNKNGFEYKLFLQYTLKHFQQYTNNEEDDFLLYNVKDLPIFYYFMFPEISAFKGFIWERTFNPEPKVDHFQLDFVSKEEIQIGYEILKMYFKIPSIEIWSDEILNSTLNQIKYAYEVGLVNQEIVKVLLTKMNELLEKLEFFAKTGFKQIDELNIPIAGELNIFFNEIMIGDNTVLLKNKNFNLVFLPQNIMSTLVSSNEKLFTHTWQLNQNLIQKSILISKSAERERIKFFNRLRKKMMNYCKKMNVYV